MVEGERVTPGRLLYLGTGCKQLDIQCADAAQILLLGGEPFAEKILVWWNFVARTPEQIEEATQRWNEGTYFGDVVGSPSPPLRAPDISDLRLKS